MATGSQRERFLLPVLSRRADAALLSPTRREGPRTTAVRRGDAFVVTGVKVFRDRRPPGRSAADGAKVTDNPAARRAPPCSSSGAMRRAFALVSEIRTPDGGLHGEFELKNVEVPAADQIGEIGQGLPKRSRASRRCACARRRPPAAPRRWTLDYALEQASPPHRTGARSANASRSRPCWAKRHGPFRRARGTLRRRWRGRRRATRRPRSPWPRPSRLKRWPASWTAPCSSRRRGRVEGHPFARLYRRIRAWRIAEGTTEILRLTVARGLLVPTPDRKETDPMRPKQAP